MFFAGKGPGDTTLIIESLIRVDTRLTTQGVVIFIGRDRDSNPLNKTCRRHVFRRVGPRRLLIDNRIPHPLPKIDILPKKKDVDFYLLPIHYSLFTKMRESIFGR